MTLTTSTLANRRMTYDTLTISWCFMMLLMDTSSCIQLKRPTVPFDEPGSSQSLFQPKFDDTKFEINGVFLTGSAQKDWTLLVISRMAAFLIASFSLSKSFKTFNHLSKSIKQWSKGSWDLFCTLHYMKHM